MKKAFHILNIVRLLAWVFLISMLFFSCKGAAPTLENTTSNVKENDSSLLTKVSHWNFKTLPVNDHLAFSVPKVKTGSSDKNCDSICNQLLRDALKNTNTQKQSGNNRYKWYYDAYTDQLNLVVELQGTQNSLRDSIAILKQKKSNSTEKIVEVPVPFSPSNWQSFFMTMGKIFSGFLLLFLGYIAFVIIKKKSI